MTELSTYTIVYDNQEIPYEVVRSARTKGKITLKVHVDGKVAAHASKSVSHKQIHKFVAEKAEWIYEQRTFFLQQEPEPEHIWYYRHGEMHYYLGERYPLNIIVAADKRQQVTLKKDAIHINAQQTNSSWVRANLLAWYQYQAKKLFAERLEKIIPTIPWVDEVPVFSVRMMKSRWGSCSSNKTLSLNSLLLRAPLECIDYILIHELCHFVEMNHSSRFYKLLNKVMPNWRAAKKKLEELAPEIIVT
jgi:hypothetical protein